MGCVTLCIQPEDEMLPDIYHLNSKAITEGHLCTTQAVVTQVGRISRAMTYVLFGRDSETKGVTLVLVIDSRVFYYRSWVRARHLSTYSFFPYLGNHNEQILAVHIFCVLVLRRSVPKHISKLVDFMSLWFFTALPIGIHSVIRMKELYYGNAGYCKSGIFLRPLFLNVFY